jgi:uncharacterized protein (TIGR02246 family)
MHNSLLIAATALALSATGVLSEEAPESAKIQATIDTMTSAFARGDIDTILSTYEPGAVVVGAPGAPVSGITALREMFTQFVALDPKFTFVDHEVVEAGDLALHLNTWRLEGRAPDGTPVEQGGLSVVVLRKQADGRWLMVIDHPYGDQIMAK